MSYSQNDEEAVILRLLDGHVTARRFLDIGAHDGVTFSNTRKLAELGWHGVLVEPSPKAFVSLQKNYEGHHCDLVPVAVVPSGSARKLAFHDSDGDMVSTLSSQHRSLWNGRPGHTQQLPVAQRVQFRSIEVDALSVADLVAKYPGPYGVLNLDVEGTNLELFRALPLRELGVQVACVEYQDAKLEITRLAAQQGYSVAHVTSENIILQAIS